MQHPTLDEEIEILRDHSKELADELESVLRSLHDRERERDLRDAEAAHGAYLITDRSRACTQGS